MTKRTPTNQELAAMIRELVDVYWGEGDNDPKNPPDIINRANALLSAVERRQ